MELNTNDIKFNTHEHMGKRNLGSGHRHLWRKSTVEDSTCGGSQQLQCWTRTRYLWRKSTVRCRTRTLNGTCGGSQQLGAGHEHFSNCDCGGHRTNQTKYSDCHCGGGGSHNHKTNEVGFEAYDAHPDTTFLS